MVRIRDAAGRLRIVRLRAGPGVEDSATAGIEVVRRDDAAHREERWRVSEAQTDNRCKNFTLLRIAEGAGVIDLIDFEAARPNAGTACCEKGDGENGSR